MFYKLTKQWTEASMLLSTRMMYGDKKTAEMLEEQSDKHTKEERLEFAMRHSNQMSSLIKAKYKDD
jgi:hypothetical protein